MEALLEKYLRSAADTEAFGAALSGCLNLGDCLTLVGDLGAGKTTFCRGLIKALCGAETEVPSPTFTLVQSYDVPSGSLLHFDLYRLEAPDDLWELGWEDLAEAISLVEWPERAGLLLPADHLTVQLAFDGEGRTAALTAASEYRKYWTDRLHGL